MAKPQGWTKCVLLLNDCFDEAEDCITCEENCPWWRACFCPCESAIATCEEASECFDAIIKELQAGEIPS